MPAKKKKSADISAQLNDRLAFYASLFVLAVFAVHPLAIGPDKYYNITETKLWTFAALIILTLVMLGCAYSYKLMQGHIPRGPLRERLRDVRPYEWALLAYWLVIFLSAVTSENPQFAFYGVTGRNEGFWMQSAYIVAVLIAGRLYRPKARDLLILCAVAAAVSLYAACQYYGYDFLKLYPQIEPYINFKGSSLEFLATMSNPNMVSTYVCLCVCVAATLFTQYKKTVRFVFLLLGWAIFYGSLIANSDSGYVGLLAVLALGFPFVAKDRRSAARLLFFLAGCAMLGWVYGQAYRSVLDSEPPMASLLVYMPYLAAALFVVSALLYWFPIPALPKNVWRVGWLCLLAIVLIAALLSLDILGEITGHWMFGQVKQLLQGDFDDSLGNGRIYTWKRALSMVPEHPILGHGPDNFAVVFYQRYYEESMEKNLVWFDKVHNEYLQVLVDAGILGLAAILAFYGLLLWAARKHLDNPVAVAVAVALVCFMVQAFFNFSTPIAHPVVWTLWGVLAACVKKKPTADAELRSH